MEKVKMSQKLTESGIMLALAAILSIFKIVELPYGGEITFASLLPVIIIAYRYGFGWGMLNGFTYGLIRLLLDIRVLSYATSAAAVAAIILLDYILAFSATALGGLFRRIKNPVTALGGAALAVCAVRFLFHVISGCTVWAGLSIPTADALLYSLLYNCTFMIPETIVTILTALYIASVLDFRFPRLKPTRRSGTKAGRILYALSGLTAIAAMAAIVVLIFVNLQNAESGEFDITGIVNMDLVTAGIIAGIAAAVIAALMIARHIIDKRGEKQ